MDNTNLTLRRLFESRDRVSRNGAKPCPIREAWILYFNLQIPDGRYATNWLTDDFLSQLSFCRSDEARRIILGLTQPHREGES